jgi:hypothetical protein
LCTYLPSPSARQPMYVGLRIITPRDRAHHCCPDVGLTPRALSRLAMVLSESPLITPSQMPGTY